MNQLIKGETITEEDMPSGREGGLLAKLYETTQF